MNINEEKALNFDDTKQVIPSSAVQKSATSK